MKSVQENVYHLDTKYQMTKTDNGKWQKTKTANAK